MGNEPGKTEEEMRDERMAWEDFKYRLSQSPQNVQDRFNSILLGEQTRFLREKHGPVRVSLEDREHFLRLASSDHTLPEIKRIIDMKRHWNAATSKDGRPPIGGAQG